MTHQITSYRPRRRTFLSRFCSTLISPVWRVRNQPTATAACRLDSILLLTRSHRVDRRREAETGSPYRSRHPKTFLQALDSTDTNDRLYLQIKAHNKSCPCPSCLGQESHRLETTSSVRAASRSCAKSTATDPCSRRDEQKGCCDHCEARSNFSRNLFHDFDSSSRIPCITHRPCREETPNHLHLTSNNTSSQHTILAPKFCGLMQFVFHVAVVVQLSISCQLVNVGSNFSA